MQQGGRGKSAPLLECLLLVEEACCAEFTCFWTLRNNSCTAGLPGVVSKRWSAVSRSCVQSCPVEVAVVSCLKTTIGFPQGDLWSDVNFKCCRLRFSFVLARDCLLDCCCLSFVASFVLQLVHVIIDQPHSALFVEIVPTHSSLIMHHGNGESRDK